jgi:hypothetical protein
MQQWEYCAVSTAGDPPFLIFYEPTGPRELQVKRDLTKGDASHYDAAARIIAELGLQGWELFNLTEGTWVFKRPKQEQPQIVGGSPAMARSVESLR